MPFDVIDVTKLDLYVSVIQANNLWDRLPEVDGLKMLNVFKMKGLSKLYYTSCLQYKNAY